MTTTLHDYSVEAFYDGDCPLCVREVRMLERWDRRKKIRFTDISAAGFDPAQVGKSFDDLMARMHGRLPDGTWIEGVEVFRRLYAAVGLGPLVVLSRLPIVKQVLDWGYAVFAKNRLRITGRCHDGACKVKG